MANMVVHPHVLAMVLCDQVIIDARTGKQSIIGSFSVIHSPRFPLRYPCLTVYAALTEGRGKTPLQLRLIDSEEENKPVIDRTMNIAFQDPRQVCELHSAFYNIQFPQSGEYRFQLMHEGEPLMERRLLLRRIDPKKMRPPQGPPSGPLGPPGGPPQTPAGPDVSE